MTYKVRVTLWYPVLVGIGAMVFASIQLMEFLSERDRVSLALAIAGGLGAILVVMSRNMAALKVEPHRIVSRLNNRPKVTVPLYPDDRLVVVGEQPFVIRHGGTGQQIPLELTFIRSSDWAEFSAAVERKWPSGPSRWRDSAKADGRQSTDVRVQVASP